jgi:hypothetical protein
LSITAVLLHIIPLNVQTDVRFTLVISCIPVTPIAFTPIRISLGSCCTYG